MKTNIYLAAMVALAPVTVSWAQEQASSDTIEETIITSHPLSEEGLSQPATVLSGAELDQARSTSIGETLARTPGVRNNSFGNAAGRPVIHGLAGPRVRIMEDRIDTLDVSVSSSDHAVSVEPFVADRIEVLKGPSVLLYGSGAIGGAVNVETGRIPQSVPEKLSSSIELRGTNNANQRVGAIQLDFGSEGWAGHVDFSNRDAGSYDVPGFVESARLRALEEAEEEEHHDDEEHEDEEHDDEEHEDEHGHDEEEAMDRVEGSELESKSFALGFSRIADWGLFGVAVSRSEARYGLPGHAHEHAHGEDEHDEDHEDEEHDEEEHDEEEHEDEEHGHDEGEEEEGTGLLDLKQTRIDTELTVLSPFSGISSLNFRLGLNDYEHVEFEANGEAGTIFENRAYEARLELKHAEIAGFTGAFGLQYLDREFSAIGEESFVPPTDSSNLGLFWVVERNVGFGSLETGARFEQVNYDSQGGPSRDFSTAAASLGLVVPLSDALTLTFHGDYSGRAPVGEELYSNGPHLNTQSFEIGDVNLKEEKAVHFSAGMNYRSDRLSLNATVYATEFSDYIYQSATGEEEDELDVLVYLQEDASFVGLDLSASFAVYQWDRGALSLRASYDFVEAELDVDGDQDIPRIPPSRFSIGSELEWGIARFALDYTSVSSQDDVAELELETDSYDDLRAYAGINLGYNDSKLELFVQGRNLTDEEQREHSSYVKDTVPLPGRTVEFGIRLNF